MLKHTIDLRTVPIRSLEAINVHIHSVLETEGFDLNWANQHTEDFPLKPMSYVTLDMGLKELCKIPLEQQQQGYHHCPTSDSVVGPDDFEWGSDYYKCSCGFVCPIRKALSMFDILILLFVVAVLLGMGAGVNLLLQGIVSCFT